MNSKKQDKKRIIKAAIELNARQTRDSHPPGTFDNGGRWYPTDAEHCECCAGIRRPSRDYPYSLLVHCRTAEHVANVFKVDVLLLKRAAKALKGGSNPENLDAIPIFDGELKAARKHRKPQVRRVLKIVAKDGDRYVSVYDDSEWALGVTRHETAQSSHGGGYYWYPSLEETLEAAESNVVFNQAWCRGKHIVVLECEAWGRVIAYGSGKRASSNLKPLHQVLDLGMHASD